MFNPNGGKLREKFTEVRDGNKVVVVEAPSIPNVLFSLPSVTPTNTNNEAHVNMLIGDDDEMCLTPIPILTLATRQRLDPEDFVDSEQLPYIQH